MDMSQELLKKNLESPNFGIHLLQCIPIVRWYYLNLFGIIQVIIVSKSQDFFLSPQFGTSGNVEKPWELPCCQFSYSQLLMVLLNNEIERINTTWDLTLFDNMSVYRMGICLILFSPKWIEHLCSSPGMTSCVWPGFFHLSPLLEIEGNKASILDQ